MSVDMEDRLPGGAARVEQQPVAVEALICGDRRRLTHHRSEEGLVPHQLADVSVMLARDHQHMCRRLRVDVPERDRALRFTYDVRWDFPGSDLAEQAVVRHARMLRGRCLSAGTDEHHD